MKKLFILSIFFVTIIMVMASVNLVEGHEINPLFIALKNHKCYLSINSNIAQINASATCLNDNYTVKITVYLQRYVNGSWKDIGNWSGEKNIYSFVNEKLDVNSNYNYRVKSIATVYNNKNNVVEIPVLYSDIVVN